MVRCKVIKLSIRLELGMTWGLGLSLINKTKQIKIKYYEGLKRRFPYFYILSGVPLVLVQVALSEQLSAPISHSSTSLQVTPFPKNPDLHSQSNEPILLLQLELTEQTFSPVWHSSISLHWRPLPSKPVLQAQMKPVSVLVQTAFLWQLCLPVAHWSASVVVVVVCVVVL